MHLALTIIVVVIIAIIIVVAVARSSGQYCKGSKATNGNKVTGSTKAANSDKGSEKYSRCDCLDRELCDLKNESKRAISPLHGIKDSTGNIGNSTKSIDQDASKMSKHLSSIADVLEERIPHREQANICSSPKVLFPSNDQLSTVTVNGSNLLTMIQNSSWVPGIIASFGLNDSSYERAATLSLITVAIREELGIDSDFLVTAVVISGKLYIGAYIAEGTLTIGIDGNETTIGIDCADAKALFNGQVTYSLSPEINIGTIQGLPRFGIASNSLSAVLSDYSFFELKFDNVIGTSTPALLKLQLLMTVVGSSIGVVVYGALAHDPAYPDSPSIAIVTATGAPRSISQDSVLRTTDLYGGDNPHIYAPLSYYGSRSRSSPPSKFAMPEIPSVCPGDADDGIYYYFARSGVREEF